MLDKPCFPHYPMKDPMPSIDVNGNYHLEIWVINGPKSGDNPHGNVYIILLGKTVPSTHDWKWEVYTTYKNGDDWGIVY